MTSNHLLLTTCLALCAVLAAGCPRMPEGGQGGPGGGMMSGPPPVPVVVQPVVLKEYAPALDLVGEIRASQRAVLTAEVGGRVVGITSRVGDEFRKAGGALISIDPASYQAALNAAQAQLAQATEALNKAQTGARDQELAVQRAQVDAARAAFNLAIDNLNRQRQLYDSGVIPESALVAAELQAEAARAGLDAAEQLLDVLVEGTREEDIAAAKAAVRVAESGVESASLNLQRTAVRPAFDAIVSGLFVEVGSFVGPGSPLVEIVSKGPGEAWFNLPEGEAATVKGGDTVEIRTDSLPGEVMEGVVTSVSPAANPGTRQFPLRVAITDPRLRPGMAVDGRLLKGLPQPEIFISSDATVKSALGVVAYVMVPPAAEGELPGVEMVAVTTGETIDDLVLVVEGNLQPGQMVVTRGNEQLYPGARIVPTNLSQEGGMGGPPPGSQEEAGAGQNGAPEAAGEEGQQAEPPAADQNPEETGAH